LVNKDYDKQLYLELYNRNFKLLKGDFISNLEKQISLKAINKMTNKEFTSYIEINDLSRNGLESSIGQLFDSFSKNNIYVKKIKLIWKNNLNGYISLKTDDYTFIEKDFSGNYGDFLFFIIPRITKLSEKQLNILIQASEDSIIESDTSVESSENNYELSTEESENIIDIFEKEEPNKKEEIEIIQFNLNSLQSEVQELKDEIIPKLKKFETDIITLTELVNNHQKFTKNSIEILENRFSRIFNVLNKEN